MTIEDLREIEDKHIKWMTLQKDGKRADLRRLDLHGMKMRCLNLPSAILSGADLHGADLHQSNLRNADLRGADLRGADLRFAVLYGANLSGAKMQKADLYQAVLHGAILKGVDLSCAQLEQADFYGATLDGANLKHALLDCTNFSEASSHNAKFTVEDMNSAHPICCPESGSFIGWKKVWGYIVKLQIPDDAKRSSAFGRKCRCSKAICLAIENPDGSDSGLTSIASIHDMNFIYRVGEVVEPDDFDDNRLNECTHGIHFFITRQEAVEY